MMKIVRFFVVLSAGVLFLGTTNMAMASETPFKDYEAAVIESLEVPSGSPAPESSGAQMAEKAVYRILRYNQKYKLFELVTKEGSKKTEIPSGKKILLIKGTVKEYTQPSVGGRIGRSFIPGGGYTGTPDVRHSTSTAPDARFAGSAFRRHLEVVAHGHHRFLQPCAVLGQAQSESLPRQDGVHRQLPGSMGDGAPAPGHPADVDLNGPQVGRVGQNVLPFSRKQETTQIVDEVVAATAQLARARMGAIIVFEREAALEQFVDDATRIDGVLSRQLLVSLFVPVKDNERTTARS